MRIGRYRLRGQPDAPPFYGAPDGDRIEELSDPFRGAPSPLGRHHRADALEILVPCQPSKVLAVGRNYREHAAELQNPVPAEPMLFMKPPSALTAHGQPIQLPGDAGRVDYEGELVLVVGRRARNLDRDGARDALLGVSCGNDVSARRYQKQDGQWTRAKGFDTFAPVGPTIAVGADPASRALVTRVNGAERQRSSTAQMIFDPLALLVFASRVMTLEPGDLFFTGTPAGVGELQPGDVVEVEIDGVGVLQNPVESAPSSGGR
jgi:2-keto-4-pentenoate hydratase/2-oxohepta-3-ene-1,7-dioic acid hydratase in catechol pathway